MWGSEEMEVAGEASEEVSRGQDRLVCHPGGSPVAGRESLWISYTTSTLLRGFSEERSQGQLRGGPSQERQGLDMGWDGRSPQQMSTILVCLCLENCVADS